VSYNGINVWQLKAKNTECERKNKQNYLPYNGKLTKKYNVMITTAGKTVPICF